MRYYFGKTLELVGLFVTAAALFAGIGITPSGQSSVANEYLFLGLGGALFTVGWLLERNLK